MSEVTALVALSATAAILHTIVPDHEIPMAMIARTRNWGVRQVTFWTLVAGSIHISISMVIGVVAIFASELLARYIGQATEVISGGMLIVFGAYWTIKAWRYKGGHGHSHFPFDHSHGTSSHSHEGINDHTHEHSHSHEGDESAHSHDDQHDNKSAFSGSATMYAAMFGIAPCFTLIPVLFAAVPSGMWAVIWVMIAYAVATIASMVVMTNIAVIALGFVMKLLGFEKQIEIATGVVIFLVGIWVFVEPYVLGG